MEEHFGEGLPPLMGEGALTPQSDIIAQFLVDEPILEKKLTFEEASQCLNLLGKDESGVRYAYLMITAIDRKLTDISTILNFKHVLFIDLTGNLLTLEAVRILSGMPFLLYLKLDRNRIDSADLPPMYYLQCLNLNRNRITETCDINQPLLETLELQDNLIYTIQFDSERVTGLKLLNLRGNQLIDFSGTYPSSLEKLFLNQNKISKILVDFSQLTNLTVLHLRDNQIKKLNGFTEQLANLTYLNLRNNKINKLREFRKLQCLPKLDTLIILNNPVCGKADAPIAGEMDVEGEDEEEVFGEDEIAPKDKSRIPLLVLLPNLKRINKDIVTYDEKQMAELRRAKILEQIFDEVSSEEETEMPTTTDFTTDYTTETEAGMYNTTVDEDEEWPTADGYDGDLEGKNNTATSLTKSLASENTDIQSPVPDGPLEDIKEDNEGELKDA